MSLQGGHGRPVWGLGARCCTRLYVGSWNRLDNPGRSRVASCFTDSVGHVSRPRCSCLLGAGHFLTHQCVPIFQMTTLRLSVDAWAHSSGAGVSSYLRGSSGAPGLGVPPFLVWDLHTRLPGSHCLRRIGAPWPSTRWWEGRGLKQLVCLKGQPMKESRSLNAWVQGA